MLLISDMNLRLTHIYFPFSKTLFEQIQNQVSHLDAYTKGFARNHVSRHQPVDILAVFPVVVNTFSQCASSW